MIYRSCRRPRIPFGNKCLDEIEIGFFATNPVPGDLFIKLRELKALGGRITCRFDFPLSHNGGGIFLRNNFFHKNLCFTK